VRFVGFSGSGSVRLTIRKLWLVAAAALWACNGSAATATIEPGDATLEEVPAQVDLADGRVAVDWDHGDRVSSDLDETRGKDVLPDESGAPDGWEVRTPKALRLAPGAGPGAARVMKGKGASLFGSFGHWFGKVAK
jgi:hypothetical protein